MPADPRLTDRDLELLSAYIDGELTSGERATLEARLEREPQLQRELRLLRQTVQLVRLTPHMRAPRDFTLTPEMVRPPRVLVFPATAAFSALSAVAAAVFVLFGVLLLQRDGLMSRAVPPTWPAGAVALAPTAATEAVEPEIVIGAAPLERGQPKTEAQGFAEEEATTMLLPPQASLLAEPTGTMLPPIAFMEPPTGGAEDNLDALAAPQRFAPDEMGEMGAPPPALDTGSARSAAAEEAPGIMMAVPLEDNAMAEIAQESSPTPTASPTLTPTSTPTLTPTATPTATPAPPILLPDSSAGVLGVLFVLLGIVAFGLFALSQAARRRRG